MLFRSEIDVSILDAEELMTLEHDYPHAYVRLHVCLVRQWTGEPKGLENQSLAWLESLKLSDVLYSYVREFVKDSDKAYYKAIEEPVSKELEKILIDYFDKFYIRREELDNLKEKFGVDSIGVFDVLAKTVYYAKNRNLLTLPEEYGHVFVELLGSIGNKKADNPLFKYMFDNIESWDGYSRVFRDYKDKYVTAEGNIDIYKIKKEAIGQAIGIALVRNYKNNKSANKSLWDKIFDKNSLRNKELRFVILAPDECIEDSVDLNVN